MMKNVLFCAAAMFAALVNHACCGVDAGGEPDGSKLGTRKISLDGGWSLSFAK